MELDLKKAQEFQLQFDGMEVDTIETAAKVRKFFKQDYPKLMLWAGVNASYIKSPVITDEPKSPSFGNRAEENITKRIYAQQTVNSVRDAIKVVSDESRRIILGVYAENKDVWSMCEIIGCERAQYQVKKRKAENEFADAFETCCPWWCDLHAYKKSDM